MYEETFGKNIDQIVILLNSEDGSVQNFVKEKKDYMSPLMKSIDEFYKYYQEPNKDKIKDKNNQDPYFIKLKGFYEKTNSIIYYRCVYCIFIFIKKKMKN